MVVLKEVNFNSFYFGQVWFSVECHISCVDMHCEMSVQVSAIDAEVYARSFIILCLHIFFFRTVSQPV